MTEYFIELEYIDKNDNGCKTGICFQCDTNKETKELFESIRLFGTDLKTCDYLIDLKDEESTETIDTIGICKSVFKHITKKEPMTEEQYQNFDKEFWIGLEKMINENVDSLTVK